MNSKSAELAQRRERLINRSARQREELIQSYRKLRASLSPFRVFFGLIKTLKAHPTLVMGLTALVLGSRRGKLDDTPKRSGLGRRILLLLRAFRLVPHA